MVVDCSAFHRPDDHFCPLNKGFGRSEAKVALLEGKQLVVVKSERSDRQR